MLPRFRRSRRVAAPASLLALVLALPAALPASAQQAAGAAAAAYPPVQILLSTSADILGRPIEWPDGAAQMTAVIVTMQPGASTGLHRHQAPMFAWVLEGEITVTYEDPARSVHVYRAGEALAEAQTTAHSGVNTGAGPLRILAVFSGAEGVPNTVSLP